MTVRMESKNAPCAPEHLDALQRSTPTPLPTDYVSFLRSQDGGRPEANTFDVGSAQGAGVNKFLSASEVHRKRAALSDRLPPGAVPVADASGGNLVLLVISSGTWRVAFWDHEEEVETEIAGSFQNFLEMLRPFSASDVPEADVVSAWIDPSLLKGK